MLPPFACSQAASFGTFCGTSREAAPATSKEAAPAIGDQPQKLVSMTTATNALTHLLDLLLHAAAVSMRMCQHTRSACGRQARLGCHQGLYQCQGSFLREKCTTRSSHSRHPEPISILSAYVVMGEFVCVSKRHGLIKKQVTETWHNHGTCHHPYCRLTNLKHLLDCQGGCKKGASSSGAGKSFF